MGHRILPAIPGMRWPTALRIPGITIRSLSLTIPALAILAISLAGLVGTHIMAPLIGWSHGMQPAGAQAASFEGQFVRWDSGYYVQIARQGYRPDGAERAFFPLYSLLAYLLSAVSGLPLLWSGWLISVVCFLLAGVVLFHWLRAEYGETTACWALLWFCFFPVSFFYVAFYPEALLMLATISSIFFARRGQFLLSGCCIAVAGGARPVAFLLAVPYVVEFVQQRAWQQWRPFIAGALLAPLGTLLFFLFLSIHSGSGSGSGDLLSVYNTNLDQNWKMATVWPWVTIIRGLQAALFGTDIGSDWFSRAVVWQDLLYMVFGVALALWAMTRLRLSIGLFFLASMLFYLTSEGPYGYVFEGMPRHVASIVPLYLMLALAMRGMPRALRWMLLSLSMLLLGLFSMWFATGRWVS